MQANNNYTFVKLLSDNGFTQSWLARSEKTSQEVFLKCPSRNSDYSFESINEILLHSYELQNSISNFNIHTAKNKTIENSLLYIEYNFLNEKKWKTLSNDLSLDKIFEYLPYIASIIDYLHLLNYIHLDIKIENFHYSIVSGLPIVKLTDLDLLSQVGDVKSKSILGTPGCIAPEILKGQAPNTRSDVFSLGKSILHFVESNSQKLNHFNSDKKKVDSLHSFIDDLTSNSIHDRSEYILNTLERHKIISDNLYQFWCKRLALSYLKHVLRNDKKLSLSKSISNKVKIAGLPHEVIHDIETISAFSKINPLFFIRKLLKTSEIRQYGEFFHINVSTESLTHFYNYLYKNHSRKKFKSGSLKKVLELTPQIVDNNSSKRKKSKDKKDTERYFEYISLVKVSQIHINIMSHYDDLLSNYPLTKKQKQNIYLELIKHYSSERNYEKSYKLIQKARNEMQQKNSIPFSLELDRNEAWLKAEESKYEIAESVLNECLTKSKELALHSLVIKSYNGLAVIAWHQGDIPKSISFYKKAILYAEVNSISELAKVSYISLGHRYFELAQYQRCIKILKKAIKYYNNDEDVNQRLFLLITLVGAFTRVGDFNKVKYWLNHLLQSTLSQKQNHALFIYYLQKGWLLTNFGYLNDAKQQLSRAIEISRIVKSRDLGKVYHNLAEIAIFTGDEHNFYDYIEKATSIFTKYKDTAALTEIESLKAIFNYYYKTPSTIDEIEVLLSKLLKNNCLYYYTICLFHLLTQSNMEHSIKLLDKILPKDQFWKNQNVPIFNTVENLYTFIVQFKSDMPLNLGNLKESLNRLLSCGQKFHGLILCRMIGQLYTDSGQLKQSRKYLLLALDLANQLSNSCFQDKLESELRITANKVSNDQYFQSIYSISELLKKIDNQSLALEKLIEFSVNETGAERGVLLIQNEKTNKLHVKAYYNCDDDSLKDITEISSKVPTQVLDDVSSLLVNDALIDNRTKGFKSIVKHNIRSIACVSIKSNNGMKGVLYLDHHTIPALFEEEDILLVKTVSNFVSISFDIIQNFKTLQHEKTYLSEELDALTGKSNFIVKSQEMIKVIENVKIFSTSDTSVLIIGERGTGKELIADLLRSLSSRNNKPFIKINCAALTDTLIDSELFGVAKNVATGVNAREGKFEAANGGTIFFDEVADLSLVAQAKLLRVLEYNSFERVGSNLRIFCDVRYIYATNKDLSKLVEIGEFRDDLFDRINKLVIFVPPLRQRPEDIIPLVNHFLKTFSNSQSSYPKISPKVLNNLIKMRWSGNIRELRNKIERYVLLSESGKFNEEELNQDLLSVHIYNKDEEKSERNLILVTLTKNNGNQSKTARELGYSINTLRRRLKKYDLM